MYNQRKLIQFGGRLYRRLRPYAKVITLVCVSIVLLIIAFRYFFGYDGLSQYNSNPKHHALHPLVNQSAIIPRVLHQTWKTHGKLPTDIHRWHKHCKALNHEYSMKIYDNKEIMKFVYLNYPEYYPIFDRLSGVYMADMARVLYTYHYGGIYMDLDFYCYRPLICLEDYIIHSIQSTLSSTYSFEKENIDLLVLSREPPIHSYYFHHKNRTVIQDFFLATPKHPFLHWLLDYVKDNFKNSTDVNQKAPFSYSLDRYLDRYYKLKPFSFSSSISLSSLSLVASHLPSHSQPKNLPTDTGNTTALPSSSLITSSSSSATKKLEVIFEMESSVIHPLIDHTNSKLSEGCLHDPHPQFHNQCHDINNKGKYLFATSNTMMAHMWTHVYLTFSYLRSWYDHQTYVTVEKTLHAIRSCPKYSNTSYVH